MNLIDLHSVYDVYLPDTVPILNVDCCTLVDEFGPFWWRAGHTTHFTFISVNSFVVYSALFPRSGYSPRIYYDLPFAHYLPAVVDVYSDPYDDSVISTIPVPLDFVPLLLFSRCVVVTLMLFDCCCCCCLRHCHLEIVTSYAYILRYLYGIPVIPVCSLLTCYVYEFQFTVVPVIVDSRFVDCDSCHSFYRSGVGVVRYCIPDYCRCCCGDRWLWNSLIDCRIWCWPRLIYDSCVVVVHCVHCSVFIPYLMIPLYALPVVLLGDLLYSIVDRCSVGLISIC